MTPKGVFSIRLAEDLRAAAEKAAKRDRRSLGSWIEKVLADRLEREGLLKPPKDK